MYYNGPSRPYASNQHPAFDEIVGEYAAELNELTFNSKPIINNLTIIAGENIHACEPIVRVIENRIMQAKQEHCLPALYLMDSIIKNLGGVYQEFFGRNIVTTFLAAFEKCNDDGRVSMLHLLKTWNKLFLPEKLQEIKRITDKQLPSGPGIHVNPKFVAGNQTQEMAGSGNPPRYSPYGQNQGSGPSSTLTGDSLIQQQQLLMQQQALLSQISNQINVLTQQIQSPLANPQDPEHRQKVTQLQQLHVLQTQLNSNIQTLAPSGQQPNFNSSNGGNNGNMNMNNNYNNQNINMNNGRINNYAAPSNGYMNNGYNNSNGNNYGNNYNNGNMNNMQNNMNSNSMNQPNMNGNNMNYGVNMGNNNMGNNMNNMGNNMNNMGNTMSNINTLNMGNNVKNTSNMGSNGLKNGTENGVNNKTKGIESAVYDIYFALSLQCKTCGLRLTDQEKMGKHLDWHFQKNKREKNQKQAVSRPWFWTSEEWAGYDGTVPEKPKSTPFFNEGKKEEKEAEPVPSSVIADEKQTQCPICDEAFDQYWDSEQEEWMYKDTTKDASDTIYHESCYSELQNSPDPSSPEATERKKREISEVDDGFVLEETKRIKTEAE